MSESVTLNTSKDPNARHTKKAAIEKGKRQKTGNKKARKEEKATENKAGTQRTQDWQLNQRKLREEHRLEYLGSD